MQNPFDWTYQTTPPASDDVFDVFTILYLVVFLVGFVVSAYLYYRPSTKPVGKLFRRKSVLKATGAAMWVFGVGLFFFLIRILQIDPLSFGEPIWMWLSVLALIGFCVIVGLNWKGARKPDPATVGVRGRQGAPSSRRPVKRPSSFR